MKSARRPRRFHSLNVKNLRLRQTWNKYNLYNIARYVYPGDRLRTFRTFFQQKWAAKGLTRAYHGEHIREKKWRRMFSRRLGPAVVDMPARYLASHSGAEQAAGRGSGAHVSDPDAAITALRYSEVEGGRVSRLLGELAQDRGKSFTHVGQRARARRMPGSMLLEKPVYKMTPYMHMTFAPLERRLDVAVFRALFASSVRQARQFCVHGAVTVNGKKIRYPNYLLNPGDMFQVSPERVLQAAGQPKDPLEVQKFEEELRARVAEVEAEEATEAAQLADLRAKLEAGEEASESTATSEPELAASESGETPAESEASSETPDPVTPDEMADPEAVAKATRSHLKALVKSAKAILADSSEHLTVKRKQQLRIFSQQARAAMSSASRLTTQDEQGKMMDNLASLLRDFKMDDSQVVAASSEPSPTPAELQDGQQPDQGDDLAVSIEKITLSPAEQQRMAQLLALDAENPIDESKPYRTPWVPRKYLAPFAFIPRYLEVNQNICAAVYLRHPVARPGLSEVPTPFPYETNQLAFNWYLRRR